MTYLFTKEGCGKCDYVKNHVELDKLDDVRIFKLDDANPEALAMLAYFECVSIAEKQMPILVSDDGEVITGAVHIKNHLNNHLS
jgi:hypothetical protein